MNYDERKRYIQRYMSLGDNAVKKKAYIDAIQYFSIAKGILYTMENVGIDQKYVSVVGFDLQQKLNTAQDLFQDHFNMLVSNL